MTSKTLHFEARTCVGCYACVVACMDQNDLDVLAGDVPLRHVVHIEDAVTGEVRVTHVSLACQHCEAAECLDACPSRALVRDAATGAVIVRPELCIGCHSCAMACPFGVPRFGRDGVMRKCDACHARTRFGYAPACADVCPTGALSYASVNELMGDKQLRHARSLA